MQRRVRLEVKTSSYQTGRQAGKQASSHLRSLVAIEMEPRVVLLLLLPLYSPATVDANHEGKEAEANAP